MAYVNATCAYMLLFLVLVVDSKFYRVTRSYSSWLFLCALDKRTVSSDVGTVCTGIGCQGRPRTNICVGRTKTNKYNDPTDNKLLLHFHLFLRNICMYHKQI